MDGSLAVFQDLVVGGLEDQLAAVDIGAAADGDAGVGLEGTGDVVLAEPEDFDVAGLVAEDGFGGFQAAFLAQVDYPGLPDVADDGTFRVGSYFRDLKGRRVVQVAAGEKVEQVADGGNLEARQAGGQPGADAAEAVDRCVEVQARGRRGGLNPAGRPGHRRLGRGRVDLGWGCGIRVWEGFFGGADL